MSILYLNSIIVNGSKIEGGPLSHLDVQVVHAGDEVTECIGQSSLEGQIGTQGSRIHEPGHDSDTLHCHKANSPVTVVELLLYHFPEDIRPRWQGDAVEEQWNSHLADVRVLCIAHIPQTVNIINNTFKKDMGTMYQNV